MPNRYRTRSRHFIPGAAPRLVYIGALDLSPFLYELELSIGRGTGAMDFDLLLLGAEKSVREDIYILYSVVKNYPYLPACFFGVPCGLRLRGMGLEPDGYLEFVRIIGEFHLMSPQGYHYRAGNYEDLKNRLWGAVFGVDLS